MDVKHTLPLLPLRDIVIFPSMVIPLFVGRDKSISSLNEVMKNNKKIILVTQKNSEVDDPKKTDVFTYGCESNILQLLKLPDGTVKVLVEGFKRVKIIDFKDDEKFITCTYEYQNDVIAPDEDLMPLAMIAVRRLEKLTSINKKISVETINNIKQLKDPTKIVDNIASHLNSTMSEKQQIFETVDVKKRLNGVIKIMENETSIIGVERKIRGRVKTQMEKTQREYYLNEQLKAIQKELGEIEDGKDETSSLNKAIIKSKMPKEVQKKCMNELNKLKNMSPMSAEATVVRNYLDWMIDVPWYKKDKIDIDLNKALKVLDEDHYGLEKVKERIIEFLAVQKRMEKSKGPILCLIGPNGAGKSTILHSIYGFTNIFSGQIEIDGKEITNMTPAQKLKSVGIAYILQDNSVFPDMTVEENLLMGGYIKDKTEESYQEVERIFEKYERLRNRRNQKAKVLSGGERRLLEISRALVMKPNVLLVDEPSIGLEPKYIDMVFEILRDLQQNEKKTIILVEQNAKKGLEFADIGYVLVSGQTAIAGKGNDLLNNPDVGRLFLGG